MELNEHRKFIINCKLKELIKLVPSDDVEHIEHLLSKYQIDTEIEKWKVDKKLCPSCGEYKDEDEFSFNPDIKALPKFNGWENERKPYSSCWDCRTRAAIIGNIKAEIRKINDHSETKGIIKLSDAINEKYNCRGCKYDNNRSANVCGTEECRHYEIDKLYHDIQFNDFEIKWKQDAITHNSLIEQTKIVDMILFYKQVKRKISNLKKEQK